MPRGRPRKFDEDEALTAAMQVFWRQGMAATSLDDLAQAMAMNRPSIYNAFGSKEDVYRAALARFCTRLDDGLAHTLDPASDPRSGLIDFFDQALEVYCRDNSALGCLMICTAPAVALTHPAVGQDLANLIARLDERLRRYLRRGVQAGDLPAGLDVRLAAKLLQATLQTLALRARSGETKKSLRQLARYAVMTITT